MLASEAGVLLRRRDGRAADGEEEEVVEGVEEDIDGLDLVK